MSSYPDPFTPELAAEICKRLADGESLRSVCRDPVMPARSTVERWITADRDGFAGQYARARNVGLDEIADELLEVAADGSNDWMKRNDPENPGYDFNGEHVQRSRLRVDTGKWYLSKLAPKRYGEKLELSGPDGQPITGESNERLAGLIGALLDRARARVGADGGERQSLLGSDSGAAT